MTHFKEATFEVISGGKTLPMYDDPDGITEEDDWKTRRYVEAMTGATFEIKVTLDQSFHWASCAAVRVTIYFDGHAGLFVDIDRKAVPATQTLATMLHYNPETRQWTHGRYMFGALDITETNDARISPQELKVLGRIRVRYQRIKYGQELSPLSEADKAARYTKYERVSSVSEKILKGQSIDTLQMIGCIPSTSPESSSTEAATPNPTAPPPDVTEELRILRARVAELENTHVKSERHGAIPNAIKRERDDQVNTSQRKRPRKSGPVETIDLTSD
ncbi:MAG: hypothetical protein LQ352_001028 [Teloschistes flavicans]|nr:MAG: hypothetical protein LQ352_001028 [Teloschistes flavicans]